MAGKQSFRARIKIRDGNPYVDISRSRARALKPGWRRPLPVLVRVNGQPARKPWRINLMPTGTALIPSRKKEILRYFSWLKSPEARERNVARAIHVLSGKKGRFMARSW